MKADISRSTFRRTNGYSGVRLQQGRVQLDSDFNEQVDIGAHRDRVTTRDVVGPSGAPVVGGGFKIGTAVLLEGLGFSGQLGVVVGELGTVLTTADGGTTWTPADSGTSMDLHAVSVLDATTAWAVGGAATLLKGNPTTGAWQAQTKPANVDSDLRGVHFVDANAGFAVGTGATILATTNGGTAWAAQNVPAGVTDDLNAVHFPAAGTGYAVGDAGRILAFANGAWTEQNAPQGFDAGLRAVRFASGQVGWAVGDGGAILSTSDGGAHWTEREPPLGVSATLRTLDFESTTVVWAAGDDGTVVRSTDGGTTWTQLAGPGGGADLRGLVARPGTGAVVAGDLSMLAQLGPAAAVKLLTAPAEARDLSISAGRLYVDGIVCENERPLRYRAQPDFPGAPDGSTGRNLVYLDVWERHVTALEDASLREVALGGPDTATRTRTTCQVKVAEPADVPPGATCDTLPGWVPASERSTGRLRARAEESQIQTNECMVPVGGGYRRLENQLYRVEIHQEGTGAAATYKWSRDNGSFGARLEAIDPKSQSDFTSGELTVSEPGRDAVIGFADAAFVELSDEGRVLRGEPGILLEVETVTGNTIKWKNYAGAAFSLASFPSKPTVRRWEGTRAVEVGQWRELEAGVFVELDGGDYRIGDYWTIPARTRTGAIEWPTLNGVAVFQPRQGVEHRYVPLAFVQLAADGTWTVETDCRELFPALTQLAALRYVGGDGQESMPGDPLPQPLEVAVFRGGVAVQGAQVRFRTEEQAGRLGATKGQLAAATNEFAPYTDQDGTASCFWQLDADTTKPSQQVKVELLDDSGAPLAGVIDFGGSLSIAEQVAYQAATSCVDLQGAKTVQAALDALCARPSGGEGCSMPVKPGERLDEVVAKLLDGGRTDLCLCLAAGDHELPEGFVSGKQGVTIRITGCGRGTRVKVADRWELSDFDAVVLRDLALDVATDNRLVFTDCDVVAIESCRIVRRAAGAGLLVIGGAERIGLEGNVFDAHSTAGAGHPNIPEIRKLLQLPDRKRAQLAATKLAERLAEDGQARKLLLARIENAGDAMGGLTDDERSAYTALAGTLRANPFVPKAFVAAMLKLYGAAARAAAGNAITLLDGNADTSVTDNQIVGSLALYGLPGDAGLNVDQLHLLRQAQAEGRLTFGNVTGTLRLGNNRLGRIALGQDLVGQLIQVATGNASLALADVFNGGFCTENVCEGSDCSLLSRQLTFSENQLVQAGLGTISTISDSAVFVGNQSRADAGVLSVSNTMAEAANLVVQVNQL